MPRAVLIAACLLAGLAGFAVGQFALPQTGLRGHYFTNLAREGQPVASAIDATASTDILATGTAAPWTTYSVEWTGAIVITRAGTYTFATVSDDGSQLEVGESLVVDNGGLHGPQEAAGRAELTAGVHPIRVCYEQAGGGFHLELKYAIGNEPMATIPAGVLLPDVTSLTVLRARRAAPYLGAVLAMLLVLAARRLLPPAAETITAPFGAFSQPRIALAVLITVAMAVRIVMMFGSNGILWADTDVFLNTENAIGRGDWFEHDPFRTLLYPYFLRAFLRISAEKPMDQIIVLAQHVLGLVTVVAVYFVGRAAFNSRIAFAGTVVLALHTTQLFYENSILTEALFICLLALALLIVTGFVRRPSLTRAIVVAVACFVLTMTRPAAQAFVAVPMVLALSIAVDWRKRLIYAGTMAVLYALMLQPWMALNQRQYGFHGIALGRGLGLFIRTAQIEQYAPSLYRAYPEVEELMKSSPAPRLVVGHVMRGLARRGYSSAPTDDLMYRASVSAIAQRPFDFALTSMRQWWRQLGSLDDEDICDGEQGPYLCSDRTIGYAREPFLNRPLNPDSQPTRRLVVWYFRHLRIPMHIVTVLAAFGAVASLAARSPVVLLRLMMVMTVVYFTLLPAVTQSLQDRFRLPVDGLLFILAAYGIAAFARIVLRRTSLD